LTRPHRHQSRLTGGLSSPSRQAEQNGPSPYLHHIVGWPVPEGRILLYDLTLHATRPEFVYSHEWQVGDLVIWDNRCTMHRGHPHDDAYPRDLRCATTLDAGSTLDEAAEPNLRGMAGT
jgi:hypothetical protein